MKKRHICVIILLLITATIVVWGIVDKSKEKEVVFANYIPQIATNMSGAATDRNMLEADYELNDDEDTLYAFLITMVAADDVVYEWEDGMTQKEYLILNYESQVKVALRTIEKYNLTILEDYPCAYYNQDFANKEYCPVGICAIAGNYEEIYRLFMDNKYLDDARWYVIAAPRPDLFEKLAEAGWDETKEIQWSTYYNRWSYGDVWEAVAGTEKQVTMKVRFE